MKKKAIIVLIFVVIVLVGFWLWPRPSKDLFKAIKEQRTEDVRRILENHDIDLDPPRQAHQVNKPLAYAAAYGNLDIIKLLLKKGADINGQVAYGDVPVIKALEHDQKDIVKYLIVNGADVNLANDFGVSPFIGFCAMGERKLVKMALAHGGKINEAYTQKMSEAKGRKNWTALQSSVVYGQLEVVKLLLEAGGDPFIKDARGKNCFELAAENGRSGVLDHLMRRYSPQK